ncbi:type ISP restriction/modification enzyme [Methylocystis echinoides]|uniref:site-specific DNA-methyltransferase (adenine-specific) n=1 Tax=Methylocystis echinoides TaxID=29468 RepID=A0A9W6GUS0_9HYPH|nr:type ISP restriction/modification enzyme [Methylocystis echinoides]GLI93286.1 hypothetical protein LMG27198_22780 [Methylocystis echinoides]
MSSRTLSDAVSAFGTSCKAKLSNRAALGAAEDQLRAPLEALIRELAALAGLPEKAVALVGESTLGALATRPDYAVTVHDALVGFIEVKAPRKGADPRRFADAHDRKQWNKLKSLPNLLYTDGNAFSLWKDGELAGKIVTLDGDVHTSGAKLAAPATFLPLVADFLTWSPTPPRSVPQLAQSAARLCRLLRDEVTEELAARNPGLTSLAEEWRGLLFPQASDEEFADGYAQAVTFGLLVARARDIELKDGVDNAAKALRKSNSLISSALRLLTDTPEVQQALESALRTLARVLDAVHWPTLTKHDADAWLYFYEDFLAVYDNALRKRTGSYYTPPEVVAAMVRLVDEALREPALFGLAQGLASPDVTLADPAAGTGAYLLGALRKIARTVEEDMGPGAVPGAIGAAVNRLIGFEMQFGPFAVAQLRLMAEIQTLMSVKRGDGGNLPALRLFVTDTLGDPYATQTQFSALTAPIGESRKQANAIKRTERITVVIGNPPYKDKAKGRGGWIEDGSPGRDSAMALWRPPTEWGVSADVKHLKNLYVYFWRWATWKVFGSGHFETTGDPDTERAGIICFITAAAFLGGAGFQKMRDELRRDCSDIWVIDCSPEGHQPDVPTRIFQGVQQPVCIVLAVRPPHKDRSQPARLHFRALPVGAREKKFAALSVVSLTDPNWLDGPKGWRDPFLPKNQDLWGAFIGLETCFEGSSSGVLPGRTWVVAPDTESLKRRWERLVRERVPKIKEELFFPTLRQGKLADRHTNKVVIDGLKGHEFRSLTVAKDTGPVIQPVRFGFRSFDRQWLIPDNRLLLSARPELWETYSTKQVFAVSLEKRSPECGPALTFSGLLPDMNFFKGSSGGRVFPLWRDAAAKIPNVRPELLAHLSTCYGFEVGAEDVMAYVAALLAHPAFTARFQADLVRPGLRVPLTADARLFSEAVALGREVVWLHCYGERFADPKQGRPASPPRLPKGEGPVIPRGGGVPGAPEPLPETMDYDPAARRLRIGGGCIENVPQAVWDYEVSGKNVLRQWFSYRKRDRSRPIIGDRRPPSPLDKIQPEHWPDDYTTDLMNLLHVLGRLVKLEPAQKDLLARICAAPLLPAA